MYQKFLQYPKAKFSHNYYWTDSMQDTQMTIDEEKRQHKINFINFLM